MNWISVKERLPENNPNEKIIVCEYSHLKHEKFVSVYYYFNDSYQDSLGEYLDESEYEVTHWMSLPEPSND